MRIIAGEFRRRLLRTPDDDSVTRPIPDRVKESLFGMLRGHCEGATIFDGFAGTGAIGLEAVSRGASHCVFVEQDRRIVQLLRENVQSLGVLDRCEVVHGDALGAGALARAPRPLTLAFLDPPYPLVETAQGLSRVLGQAAALIQLLSDDGIVVVRTPWPLIVREAPQSGATRGKPARVHRAPRRRRGHEEDMLEEESIETAAPAPTPGREVKPEGLRVEGAVGPEVHTYRGMALHLYMKDRR